MEPPLAASHGRLQWCRGATTIPSVFFVADRQMAHRDGALGSSWPRQEWIATVGVKTPYIERGSPWENGYIESFNAPLRDELLNGEIFYSPHEAQIVVDSLSRKRRGSE